MGDHVIEIKNGIQTSLESTVGYVPTIDIYLSRNKDCTYNDEEWEFLREDVKLQIENKAINIVPFRIIYSD